eukprot:PhF_6_TR43669/c0_g1_i2/m.67107/K01081/E3.1.3.5; 5'-nucleotidase
MATTSTVHYPNRDAFAQTLANIKSRGGLSDIKFIVDFDHTVSKFYVNDDGKTRCSGCFTTLESSPSLPSWMLERSDALRKHHYPIEIDPTIPRDVKEASMDEWSQKAHDNFIEVKYPRSGVADAVDHSNIQLRNGFVELCALCEQHSIPILIFSAGVGNVIEEVLVRNGVKVTGSSSLHIVSNWMIFDDTTDIIRAWSEPRYHVFNKDARGILHMPYFEASQVSRKGLILVGDSLGDLNMQRGVDYTDIVKIGFLNEKVEERMTSYMENWDVVLTHPESFQYVLQEVIAKL